MVIIFTEQKVSSAYTSPAHDFYLTNTNYIDENVENGTTYYYICKVVYNDKSESPPSNEVMVTPKPLSLVINITNNQKVTNSKFTFTGKVDVGSEVYVNGNKVDVDSNGNFTATVTLVKGTNTIKIEVKNKPGDTITITKTVIYEEVPPPPTPPSGTFTIILQINNPQMIVNGVKKEIDPGRGTVPVIVKGRTLVPIRAIIEEMGGEISWDGTERKVTIKLKEIIIELWIDKTVAKVNGVVKTLDVPPQIINGRTMLPLRFVVEELGCTVDWDGTTKTITITYKKEQTNLNEDINKISKEGEKIFGPSGGELNLSDGTKLVVSSNAFSKDTKVTLKSIINPSFYSQDALGFEITGLKELKGDITLYANGPKGLKNDELNIFGYDHESDEKIDLNYSYDSNSGIVSIKISPSTLLLNKKNFLLSNYVIQSYSKILGFKDKLILYIGWMPYYTPKKDEKIIRMPYYEQIGGSCASTCAQMLLKYSGNDIELFDILKELKASDTDFGLSSDTFANSLRDFISRKTGFSVIHIPYFAIAHLKWKILSELDKGHPVILNWGKHVVLVLGYKDNGNEIIIHDPQNISPATNENGTMYTVRNWNWIKERHKYATERYYIIYPDSTFAVNPSLSLMCPGNDETYAMSGGEIAFYIINPNSKKLTSFFELQIKPSEQSNGYIWMNMQTKEKIDSIQQDAEVLKLKLYAYNGSTYAKEIEIQTAIEEDKGEISPGKKISSNNQKFSISEAKFDNATKVVYEYEYKLEDLRDYSISNKDGKEKILIHASLWEDTLFRDSFIIKATLNILPKVTSINPTTGKGGDEITINGFSFGKNKTTKSRVMIGNKEVEIISWSDKEIKVKLPQDIESGPVVVYTGEKYEYESNKDILFNTQIQCSSFYSEVFGTAPSWSNIDCKWETTNRGFYLCIQAKNGVISGNGTCYSASQEVSGSIDKDGNINFSFIWKDPQTNNNYGYIISGNFTGKFVKGCIFYGTATGKVRVYHKNPIYCKPYDIEKEFSSPMYDKNYKP